MNTLNDPAAWLFVGAIVYIFVSIGWMSRTDKLLSEIRDELRKIREQGQR